MGGSKSRVYTRSEASVEPTNGKGSKIRPMNITREMFNRNWERIFGKSILGKRNMTKKY